MKRGRSRPRVTRRDFLATSAAATSAMASLTAIGSTIGLASRPLHADDATANDRVAFFLIGDTHYLADKESPDKLDERSAAVTSRLIATLNELPGTDIPESAGGGAVLQPRRYNPLDSLEFLIADLKQQVGDSKRPVIVTHHVDNSSHFAGVQQAFLYFEIADRELIVRECGTKDAWQTRFWTPQVWRRSVNA